MLTNKVLALQFKISIIKSVEKFYAIFPFNKKRKFLHHIKTGFKKKNLESKLRRQFALDNFGPNAEGVLFNTINGLLISHLEDVEINHYLGFQGQYDWNNITSIMSYVAPTTNLYILGAHVGSLLIPLSRKVNRVFAFEANPKTFQKLQLNIFLNNVINADIYNLAVYNANTKIRFYQNVANTGGSKIKPIKNRFIYNYDSPDETEVQAVILDDLIKANNLPQPNFIIMDIEGAEFFALQGAAKCLIECQYLYVEFVPHHLFNISNIDVNTFLSVIIPYFCKMQIINNGTSIYVGEQIIAKLKELYAQNKVVDLLFLK